MLETIAVAVAVLVVIIRLGRVARALETIAREAESTGAARVRAEGERNRLVAELRAGTEAGA